MAKTLDLLQAVRFYTASDPYYYTVDNRPLGDLNQNVQVVANAVEASVNANLVNAYTYGHIAQAVYGRDPKYIGTREFPGGLVVRINPGILVSPRDISDTDTRQFHQIAVNQDTIPYTCTNPSTGQSKVYLVQGRHVDPHVTVDKPVAYYDRTNIRAEGTIFTGHCEIQFKEGAAAATGTEQAPTPDSGWYPLFTIRVADTTVNLGDSNITNVGWQNSGTGGGGSSGGGTSGFRVTAVSSNSNPTCTFTSGGNCVNTVTLTATPSGGSGTYTFVWNQISGPTTGVTYPTGNEGPSISVARAANSSGSLTFKVTCTDTIQNQTTTADVIVSFNHTVSSGGSNLSGSIVVASPLECTFLQGESGCTDTTTATVTASGGTGSYTYNWLASGLTITAGQGTSTVTVSYTGNTFNQTVSLQCSIGDGQSTYTAEATGMRAYPYGPFSATVPASMADTCVYQSGGTCLNEVLMTCTASGGKAPYTYSWSKVSGTGTIHSGAANESVVIRNDANTSSSGVFRCTVTDANGRSVQSNNSTVTWSHSLDSSGASWTVGSSAADDTPSCSYTSGNSCTSSTTITASTTGSPAMPLTYSWAKLNGDPLIAITAGQGTNTITVSRTGTGTGGAQFRVTVTDNNGIAKQGPVITLSHTHSVSVPLTVDVTTSPASCQYSNPPNVSCTANTSCTATVSGGTPPYAVFWEKVSGSGGIVGTYPHTMYSEGMSTVNVQNTSGTGSFSGVFRCTIQDVGGLGAVVSDTATVNFTHLNNMSVSAPSNVSATCTYEIGTQNACTNVVSIPVTVSGGTPPYTYNWSKLSGLGNIQSGQGTANLTVSNTSGASGSGTFRVLVLGQGMDDSGTADVVVNFTHTGQVAAMNVTVSGGDAYCTGSAPAGCTASRALVASVTGGVGPYTYSWSKVSGAGSISSGSSAATCTVQNSFTATGATSGTFRVIVTDSQSRTASRDYTVGFSSNITAQAISISLSDNYYGMCMPPSWKPYMSCTANVTLSASVSGGVPPYSYAWVQTSGPTYTLTGASTSSCTASASVPAGQIYQGNMMLTVVDSMGTSATATTFVELENGGTPD